MASSTQQFPSTTAAPATAPQRTKAPLAVAAARTRAAARALPAALQRNAPGLLLCAAAVVAALSVNALLPAVSPLIAAIVLGVLVANTVRLPDSLAPGIAVAAKKLLRWGIVFLGLQLVLSDIAALGVPM